MNAIAEQLIELLAADPKVAVSIKVEIEAVRPDGFDKSIVDTVMKRARY